MDVLVYVLGINKRNKHGSMQRSLLSRGPLQDVQDYSSKGSGVASCLGGVLSWEGLFDSVLP